MRRSIQLSQVTDMYKPGAVMAEAEQIFLSWYPERAFVPVRRTFSDFLRLYSGKYPGYCACSTDYHDEMHITDSFLAMARLVDGYNSVHETRLPPRLAALGFIAALLHDAGFIQTKSEKGGTGAKYTLTHVERSVSFVRRYFRKNKLSADSARIVSNALLCTELSLPLNKIRFRNEQEKTIGFMVGSADLLGQMASRCYLERLLLLYNEFREAGVPGYDSELELLRKTVGFSRLMDERLTIGLGNMRRYLRPHFNSRRGVDRDLYAEAMEKQIEFLEKTVLGSSGDYRKYLRRRGR